MCKVSTSMIVADGAAVGSALENIAAALQTENPTLATQLTTAGQGVVAATANWKTGDTLDAVVDAENAAIIVLNDIPTTSTYAPLVAIAFAGLNLLIANSTTQDTQVAATTGTANVRTLLAAVDTVHPDSPWKDKAQIKHTGDIRKNFVEAFNEKAAPLGVKPVTI